MRQINKTRGGYIGVHYIFTDYTEAVKYLGGELSHLNKNEQDLTKLDCFPHWYDDRVREWDWITSDNGNVLQCIKIYNMKNKTNPTIIQRCIKTIWAMGFYSLNRGVKKLSQKGLRIIETETEGPRTFGEGRAVNPLGRKLVWKRLFVYYLVIYTSPVFAFMMVAKQKDKYTKYHYTYRNSHKAAYTLMRDPFILTELEKYMKIDTFRNRLSKALEGEGINEERIVRELSSGLEEVKKGTQTHKQFIELAMNISRYATAEEEIGTDGKQLSKIDIERADFSELPPAPKQIADLVNEETKELVTTTNEKVESKYWDDLQDEVLRQGLEELKNSKIGEGGDIIDDI